LAVALVAGAGSGERLGGEVPKALVPLDDRPMIAWSLQALGRAQRVDAVVIAAPPGFEQRFAALAGEFGYGLSATVVAGGASRSASVANALAAAPAAETVVVHDAARPLAGADLFDLCLERLESWGCDGAIAAVPATDTIKQVAEDGSVRATLDRARLWAIQTPQAFRAGALRGALSSERLEGAYDDAQLVEANGGDVRVVESTPDNIKVTTPTDLRVAELLLAGRRP
jgi:2-C-methyl-D-erythritol 4-phosphate cytidylyltransferase